VLILHLGMEVMQILMRIEVKKNVLCISFFVTSKIFPLLIQRDKGKMRIKNYKGDYQEFRNFGEIFIIFG
jgi:hypothetical protein